MHNNTHWSLGLAVIGLLSVAAAILYAGILRQPAQEQWSSVEQSAVLPLGESLDFSSLATKLAAVNDIAYPVLSPSTEVGVDLSGLFRALPAGVGTYDPRPVR